MERQFIIFNIEELFNIDFNEVLESSINTIRKSLDGKKTFVKYEGKMPNCVHNLKTKEIPYNNDEMIVIINNTEWTEQFFN